MSEIGQMNIFRKTCGGYVGVANGRRTELFHRVFVESKIGIALPKEAQIHHADGNKSNNDPTNLVVCPSISYHRLLHQRMRSLEKSGNANWRKCRYCAKYDDPANLIIRERKNNNSRSGADIYHRDCKCKQLREANAKRRIREKEQQQ